MVEEFETNSCIRRYHVYQDRWLPIIGEQLEENQEIQEIAMLQPYAKVMK